MGRDNANGRLPDSFFIPDKYEIRGGIEFGFTSMTMDRAQALHYAEGRNTVYGSLSDWGGEMCGGGGGFWRLDPMGETDRRPSLGVLGMFSPAGSNLCS